MEAQATRGTVTALLAGADSGRAAFDQLLPLVYDELRAMARRQLAGDWRQRTLDTTGLVHEAYLKLVDETAVPLRCRAYFFAAAARSMRQVLVDAARRRSRLKRGGGAAAGDLEAASLTVDGFAAELLDLDRGLERLARDYPRQAEVLECRFFAGLSVDETARALDLSPRTVKRDWSLARAWLYRELRGDPAPSSG
ncbi:MAG TPA: ECF-type sigma factor [Thermoanaerobaculia bacterium]|nr:ECF-type sigma factor [Thermoanaerobaculia bacterium]